MEKTVRKIGNSQGIILAKSLLDQLGIKVGDELQTKIQNGKIVLSPRGK